MEGGSGRNTQELIIVGLNYSKEYFKKDIRRGFLMLKVVTDLDWLPKKAVEFEGLYYKVRQISVSQMILPWGKGRLWLFLEYLSIWIFL